MAAMGRAAILAYTVREEICANCKRENENVKGRCPFCSHESPTQLMKRQRERADESEMSGPYRFYTVTCEKCGQDVSATVTRFSGGAARQFGSEWVIPETHDCQKSAKG